jgi:hypothetical protein
MNWLIIVVVLVGVAILVAWAFPRFQAERLRRQFGPEYDRVLEQEGDRRRVDAILRDRRSRWAALDLHPLDANAAGSYRQAWQEVQLRFVDEPEGAVAEGHTLVREVMRARGYPIDSFLQRTEMLSVEQPILAQQYRAACAVEADAEGGRASLDDQRQAFQAFRLVFHHVVGAATIAIPADDVAEEARVEGRA